MESTRTLDFWPDHAKFTWYFIGGIGKSTFVDFLLFLLFFFSLIIKGWCLYVYQNKSNEEYNEI